MTFSRRTFSMAAGSVVTALGAGATALPGRADAQAQQSADKLGISNSNGAIHQDVVFKASAAGVYHVLTDAREFDRVVLLSGAIKAMALKNTPGQISTEPGGTFSIFGGYITGRQIELSPNVRIIQAWRSASWPPNVYSIAKFELNDSPDGVRLAFDQTGFPNDDAISLANGWRHHYWEPLAKVLA